MAADESRARGKAARARASARAGTGKAETRTRLAQALPDGEDLAFAVHGAAKPPRWFELLAVLGILAGVVPGLVLMAVHARLTRRHYLAVTGKNVYLLCGRGDAPPTVTATFPLGAVPIARVATGLATTTLHLRLPGRPKPLRLIVPLLEKAELDRLLAASTAPRLP
jgi:hypothetical protein